MPPGTPALRGTTVHHPLHQDWFIWHPIRREHRRVAVVEFVDGEVLRLADDVPAFVERSR